MADEITVIGIGVDTTQVVKAATDLDKFSAAGTRAEKSVSGIGSASAEAGKGASKLSGPATTAAQSLAGIGSSAGRAQGELGRFARTAEQAETAAQALSAGVGGVSSRFGALSGVLGGISASAAVAGFVRLADTVTTLDARLRLVTQSAKEFAVAREGLFNVAQQTGTWFEQTADLFGSLSRSTEALGVSQSRVLEVTRTINQALAVSGTSAQSASAALVQLGQGFASGALRGEELNSVLEQAPRLARAIADGLGVSVGKLREIGQEGKLTGEQVFQALEKSAKRIDSEFSRLPLTVGRASTQAANSLLVLVGAMDSASGSTASLAGVISESANAIAELGKEITKVSQGAESVSILANAFVILSETVRVLSANVAFVLSAVGREIGAVFAQIGLVTEVLRAPPGDLIEVARRNWGQFNAISEAVKADGERARAELDRLEARVLSRTPTPDLGQTDRRELARRGRFVDPFGQGAAPKADRKSVV